MTVRTNGVATYRSNSDFSALVDGLTINRNGQGKNNNCDVLKAKR